MAAPTSPRPVQDAIIDPIWGQWVHDNIPTAMPKVVRNNVATEGLLLVQFQATVQATTDSNGVFLFGYGPFASTPIVIGQIADQTWPHQLFPFDIQLSVCQVVARTVTGDPIRSTFVNAQMLAIGIRPAP